MLALALGLASSLSWGAGDFFGGMQAKRLPGIVVVAVSQAVALGALAVAFIASSALSLTITAEASLTAAAAGLCGGLGLASIYRALAVGKMGVVAPIAALGVLVPVIVGAIGGERPSAVQTAGMAAALAGSLLAARATRSTEGEAQGSSSGLGLAVTAACFFGAAMVGLDRVADDAGAAQAVLVARIASVSVLSTVIFAVRIPVAGTLSSLPALACIGLLDLGAVLLFAVATTQGLLSIVAIAGSLAPVVTVALAALVLGERLSRAQMLGVVLALSGIVCIGAG
jgi:drug/metabolite transporter (DMT)-like permease